MRLFSDKERDTIEAISALNYENPFSKARIDLERRILGDAWRDQGQVWSAGTNGGRANQREIATVTAELAAEIAGRVGAGRAPESDELAAYEGLMVYHLFESHRADFAELIESPKTFSVIAFHKRFDADVKRLLTPAGIGKLPTNYKTDHLMAMFFQIHRAFKNIFEFLIGGSDAAGKLRESIWQSVFTSDIRRYQRALLDKMNDIPTLVTGPSGTGKELVARAVANSSHIPFSESKKAFVFDHERLFHPLHIGAIPANLLESELFGHAKGAFTGAVADKPGSLEGVSRYGSLFLDELAEIPAESQVKLLRVLQTRSFRRVGESRERGFEGRIIAATNRDLSAEIAEGRFRADLYYRLCADMITTPTLSEQIRGSRKETRAMLAHIAGRVVGPEESNALADETLAWIERELGLEYEWPGNVREMEQCLRNVLIRGAYVPLKRSVGTGSKSEELAARMERAAISADELLSEYCAMIHERTGSYVKTAELLGLDRRTVKAKIDNRPQNSAIHV